MIKSFFNTYNINYEENASLKKYNTYKIDAKCQFLVFPKNEEELLIILKKIKENNIKYLILGNGSNIILAKDYYDGIVIKLDNLNQITYNENIVTVGAGYSLIKLAIETSARGLDGLTFAAGIPGCVGASTAMNAGAYNTDMANVIEEVTVINEALEIEVLKKEKLNFTYRDSFLKQHPEYVVLATKFRLSYADPLELKKHITERRKKRLETQPLDMPNAGSVFRNPKDMYAGALIEELNLKGYSIGGAEVSTKHANFIINSGNATGQDIIALINKIKKDVKDNYNVDLKLEQIIIE